jgi:hypothetical protein
MADGSLLQQSLLGVAYLKGRLAARLGLLTLCCIRLFFHTFDELLSKGGLLAHLPPRRCLESRLERCLLLLIVLVLVRRARRDERRQ